MTRRRRRGHGGGWALRRGLGWGRGGRRYRSCRVCCRGRGRRGKDLICKGSAKQGGGAAGNQREECDHEPLTTKAHVRLSLAIEHHGASRLNRTNAHARREQCRDRKEHNETDDENARTHKAKIIMPCCGVWQSLAERPSPHLQWIYERTRFPQTGRLADHR